MYEAMIAETIGITGHQGDTIEAYYARPGHLPLPAAGTETMEFSPTDGLGETMAIIAKNLGAMESSGA